MASPPEKMRADIETRLASLRDSPIDTANASPDVLSPIYEYLMAVPTDPTDRNIHWFCAKADSVTIDAATFLIRLFAYDSGLVEEWKKTLEACLTACPACVQSFGEVKLTSRHTYFGAFPDEVINFFYVNVDAWELRMVVRLLSPTGISVDPLNRVHPQTLAQVPPALVYHMLSNIFILQDPWVSRLIHSIPLGDFLAWPTDIPPPGLLLLILDEEPDVRQWARNQISKSTLVPIPKDRFTQPFITVLEIMAAAVAKYGSIVSSQDYPPASDLDISAFSFTSDPTEFWSGVGAVLRLIPPELMVSNSTTRIDFRRIIIGHLHDTGPQFPEILRCFILLLKRIGSDLWQGEKPEYAQVVFDAVKDNPSLLWNLDTVNECPWNLAWFWEFLHTIDSLPAYSEVLAKMVDFMCEELQHERFRDTRPAILVMATRLLTTALDRSRSPETSHQREAISSILDIHTDKFIAVAFGRSYNEPKWQNARIKVRELISNVWDNDVRDIEAAIFSLCKMLEGAATVHVPHIRKQMWKVAFETLQPQDVDGLQTLIAVVSRAAHLDLVIKAPFEAILQPQQGSKAEENALAVVNSSLTLIHQGFADVLSRFADYNASSVLDLLRLPGAVKSIMPLMLSPVEGLQAAAQNLVGQAFDVDVRLDCFRELLANLPNDSLAGIFDFLETFTNYAPIMPEACSLSKSLVRCLTDIIEVLCASRDGLLRRARFMKPSGMDSPAAGLPRFWSLMAKSIAVIFKRTPSWSTYFEAEEMVVWMRDALIFGRDMLAQRKVIEAAAISDPDQLASLRTPTKLSRVGRKMVGDLQTVLPELARWLRLTDEELLHQSFSLLQSLLDCFRETGVPPFPAGIAKLNKHIEDARRKDPSRLQTRLDSNRLSQLESALASFDDDIQIISPTFAPKQLPKDKDVKLSKQLTQRFVLDADTKSSSSKTSVADSLKRSDHQRRDAEVSVVSSRKAETLLPIVSSKRTTPPLISKRKESGSKYDSSRVTTPLDVPSSESSSEEEPEGQGGLASLGKLQRSPKIKKPVERRQVKMLVGQGDGVKARQDLAARRDDARRMALRLKPDISRLHRILLSWNYDHAGSEPPVSKARPALIRVPDQFSDHDEYLRVFEPLLLLECWSQIVKSKDEIQEIYQAKITAKQYTDDWADMEITISESVKKEWFLAETDVVLLRNPSNKKCVLAKVRSYIPKPTEIQVGIRCFLASGSADPGLTVGTTWQFSKVFSLSTLHREYAALVALPHYDMFETILRPQLYKLEATDRKEVNKIMVTYQLNEPQAIAISSSLKARGFGLIQGPPGTGKTSTICGLVDAILAARSQPTVAVYAGRNGTSIDRGIAKKILVCAPSNAAIDELAYRLKKGSRGSSKVVRVGADRSINISVKDISLDTLIENKMNSEKITSDDSTSQMAALREEIESVKRVKQEKIAALGKIRDNAVGTLALQDEIRRLNARRMTLTRELDKRKDKQKSDSRSLDATRRKLRLEVLSAADIICSTLSGAGRDFLEQFDYEIVIIDEAAQAVELSSLIPLRYSCRSCIMVGDPQQLPPTVLSQEATKFHYNQSLFVRLQKHQPDAVHLLSIQYRMHPDISQLPSRIFYEGRLKDGPDMAEKTKQPWHSHAKFGTYRFYNVGNGQEQQTPSHSLKNLVEAKVALALFSRLRQEFSSVCLDFRVGVVSMYSAQVAELRRRFRERFGPDILETVDFNTVDGFQGQEKDIIILSCVRAGPGLQKVGFLADIRRMNVALTRAKSSLFILGNAATLERSDDTWRNIVQDSRSRLAVTDANAAYFMASKDPPRAPSPRKAAKASQASQPQPIPANLSTPREMKAAMDRRHAPGVSKSIAADDQNTAMDISVEIPVKHSPDESRGEKRPASDPQTPLAPRLPAPETSTAPVRPPPKKRPKQAPNLFMPKSKQRLA